MKPTLDALEQQLKRYGHRITQPRQLVFLAFANAEKPASAKDLLQLVPLTDRATIYRTIQLFLEADIITSHTLTGGQYFTLSETFTGHQHFIVCQQCQKITIIKNRELEKLLPKMAAVADYKLTDHKITLTEIVASIPGANNYCQSRAGSACQCLRQACKANNAVCLVDSCMS